MLSAIKNVIEETDNGLLGKIGVNLEPKHYTTKVYDLNTSCYLIYIFYYYPHTDLVVAFASYKNNNTSER